MFASIKDSPDEKVLKKHFTKEMQSFKAKQTKIKLDLSKLEKQKDKLEGEIAKTLTGESAFTPEQLSKVIANVEAQIREQQEKLDTLNTEMTDKKSSMEKIKPLYDRFKSWSEEFGECTLEQKKMIISQIIDRIEVGRDYKINLVLNMTYQQFCEDWDAVNK
jgi:chromosome segregation ATPase